MRSVIYSQLIHVADAPWIRLRFAQVELGEAPAGGQPTILCVTSLRDGARQVLRADHLRQWANTTAYFNGDAVMVQLVADGGTSPSRLAIASAWVGDSNPAGAKSLCFIDDDRTLSSESANARLLESGCTAWIISDASNCLLTAGHCATSETSVAQFNVPLSNDDGTIVHPPPHDQYIVDPASIQLLAGGTGNDWQFFGCQPNPITGLTPYQAQQSAYELASTAPPVMGQQIRVTGYGTVAVPIPLSWNQAQKSHTGPYISQFGTVIRYQTDTTGGNSGSPVWDTTTGMCIGIHTEAGCWTTGGANQGTAIHHAGLQNALKNPLGVCLPQPLPCPADVTGDRQVNVGDLLSVINAWGHCAGCAADVNHDDQVNVADLLIIINAWGACP